MPIYEYRCQHCAHELEIMQKMADDPITECPECGQNSLEKLISRSSFRLKGGGWYDSGYSASRGEKPPETKPEAVSESKNDTKSETKTESKSEASKPVAESKPSAPKTTGVD